MTLTVDNRSRNTESSLTQALRKIQQLNSRIQELERQHQDYVRSQQNLISANSKIIQPKTSHKERHSSYETESSTSNCCKSHWYISGHIYRVFRSAIFWQKYNVHDCDRNVRAGYWRSYRSDFGREKAAASSTSTVKTKIGAIAWKLQKSLLSRITGHHQNTR